jgi:hypothetical protein
MEVKASGKYQFKHRKDSSNQLQSFDETSSASVLAIFDLSSSTFSETYLKAAPHAAANTEPAIPKAIPNPVKRLKYRNKKRSFYIRNRTIMCVLR